MNTNKYQSVTIQIPDGDTTGVWKVDGGLDWNGRVILCPRACYEKARSGEQFKQGGVYVLRQPNDRNPLSPKIYIGQATQMIERLNYQYAHRDWHEVFICVDDSGGKLTSAHIDHLESRMIQMAKLAKLCDVLNDKEPMPQALPRPDEETVAGFLTKLLFILRVLGLDIFETCSIPSDGTSGEKAAEKKFHLTSKGVTANAYRDSRAFVVLANSEAVLREVPHASESIIANRKSLQDKGVLKVENKCLRFSQDREFNSPSAAAQVVVGGAADGRLLWKNEQGKTIKELEAEAAKQPTTIDQKSVAAEKKVKKPNLDFVKIGVPIGSVLRSTKDAAFSATVVGSKKVKIGNEEMSLTEATRRALKLPSGSPIQPSPHWRFNGKLLHDLYETIYGVGDEVAHSPKDFTTPLAKTPSGKILTEI